MRLCSRRTLVFAILTGLATSRPLSEQTQHYYESD